MTDFHRLYATYSSDIYRFAYYLCGNKTDAEDITAETFAHAMTGKITFVDISVKAYLLQIARNLHFESIRNKKRYMNLPEELLDSSPNVENEVSHKIELESLFDYLQGFPEVDRTALLLRSEGYSYEEIIKILDISLASAKVKVHRIRLKLVEWRLKNNE